MGKPTSNAAERKKRLSFLIVAATLAAFGVDGSVFALGAGDFLRVGVSCPRSGGNGTLETLNENVKGAQGKIVWTYLNGQVVRVVGSESPDGVAFTDWVRLDKPTDAGDENTLLFRGYEQMADEMLRFFCNANQETKQRYLELMKLNRGAIMKARMRETGGADR